MKIAIGCDHGALQLKEALIPFLRSLGHSVEDFGTCTHESCDYSDFAIPAAKAVSRGRCDRAIVLCTTGIGASIAANKVRGIRCALVCDTECAKLTRLHNDSNVLAMGAAVVDQDLAFEIVKVWLSTPFSGEARHQRRINKVMECEDEEKKKKPRRRRRRRRRIRLGGLAGNLIGGAVTSLLSVILVISMLLTPIATYITNITDPQTLVSILFDSGLFNDRNTEEESPTEVPDTTEPDATVPETTDPDATAPETTDPDATVPETTDPDATAPENADEPATIDESEGTEPETTEPDATEPDATDPDATDPDATEPEVTEPEITEPTEPDHVGDTADAANSLLDTMAGLAGTDIIDTEHLNEFLNIPEGTVVDTALLGKNLAKSEAAEALVSAYMTDVMNTAMGIEGQPSLTPETAMSIVSPHIGELADIVHASLPEGVELDRAHLEEITRSALEAALPNLVAGLPDLGSAANDLLQSENPIIATAASALRFIRTGALRAAVLLVVIAMCALICLVRLPGLRGLRCVGICGIVGGALCYAITMVTGKLPELASQVPAEFAEILNIILEVIHPITDGVTNAYTVCAVVYIVIGAALVIGTTLLRGFFSILFGRFFSDEY
ncbi:MAG: ribose 5-phosphate isomerase B [Ruminococcaceae bacterium]|nr:ribose 5-phosphate isomerase B [Oscillospiraceae bacterium]